MGDLAPGLAERYAEIRARIEGARALCDPAAASREITLIAVSKHQPIDAIQALYQLGHRDFGENYVQELVEKADTLRARGCEGIRWHFIGHLQTNKVKAVLEHVHCVHTVDSEKLARELAKRWAAAGRGGWLPVFVEVNIDDEPTKAGVVPDGARPLAELIVEELGGALSLQGLMCLPAASGAGSGDEGMAAARSAFARLRALEASCAPWTQGKLSMGMSGDFEQAILEGATHVRVGTALFGQRLKGGPHLLVARLRQN